MIISRYFSKQLISVFIMLMLILTGLAWMLQIMSLMKFLITYGVDLGSFAGLTVLMIPFIISIIIPFVAFIATIFVYNRMIAENEVTVMASVGMSPRQIARPAMMLAGVLTALHFALNFWTVPDSQARFYDTQWELRYGLAHMKLQESAFTELTDGLVVYVDKVSGYDLSQLMLSDTRSANNEMTVFAEAGKLVATPRGLSIVMSNGSLLAKSDALTVGRFDTFDMDMEVAQQQDAGSLRVRRVPTRILLREVWAQDTPRHHEMYLSEIATRLLTPFMNLILAGVCVLILLKSSLLRRRASFAPMLSVAAMAGMMALFMSATNTLSSVTDICIMAGAQFAVLGIILLLLFKK